MPKRVTQLRVELNHSAYQLLRQSLQNPMHAMQDTASYRLVLSLCCCPNLLGVLLSKPAGQCGQAWTVLRRAGVIDPAGQAIVWSAAPAHATTYKMPLHW